MLTRVAVDLILRDDDLAGVGVVGVLDWMAQDADDTDHLARLTDAVRDVAGVTDELLAPSHLQQERNSSSTFKDTYYYYIDNNIPQLSYLAF